MPVTTVDIDAPVLAELERLQRTERKSMDRLVSDLLAEAIRQRTGLHEESSTVLHWHTTEGGFQIDPADKEALARALDSEASQTQTR